jgi:hypothetical protein
MDYSSLALETLKITGEKILYFSIFLVFKFKTFNFDLDSIQAKPGIFLNYISD